jgi:FkbM family methyltransferase
MRKLLKIVIPDFWISQRNLFKGKIIFKSKEHLNLFFYRSYESEVWNSIKERIHLAESAKIVDIGANIGQAMLALNNLFPNNPIECYEPQYKEFCYLEINRLVNSVPGKSYNCAIVAEEKEEVSFVVDKETGGRTSFVSSASNDAPIKVPAKYFASLIDDNVGLIKIDIEGYECELFKKPLESLKKVFLIIEVRETTSRQILEFFLPTHEIFHLEEKRKINKLETIGFSNLLCTPIDLVK